MPLNTSLPRLALFGGQGDLPQKIIQKCQQEGRFIFLVAFEGQTPEALTQDVPHDWVKLGALGKLLDILQTQKIDQIVFAGGIKRPAFSELSLDWEGTKFITRIGFKSLGDDALLTHIATYFEEKGYGLIAPHTLLHNLLVDAGPLTQRIPTPEEMQDIQDGVGILTQLGYLDIGQSLIIQEGLILGIEAIEGTAELIRRVKAYQRPSRGGILIKMAKPQQHPHLDLPTIGPETVKQAAATGLVGIAVEAAKGQLLHKDDTIFLANHHNIFIYGFDVE